MTGQGDPGGSSWRHKWPLLLGLFAGGLLFVYLVLPGFLLGLLFHIGVIDPRSDDLDTKRTIHRIFFVPMFLGDSVKFIGDFYEWQVFVATGHR